ncbi:hypothetical protein Dde_2399 [Oleidesulfovibrio alaskensis G20]|jgi:uncharacterized lipoprotein YajG|uniref:Lipoprotein n=1 Tax=Oleidesulfovibrio alaskensis (strain ATCC BAA-1058 / DSM 17464 / G20) TaxID=207559 RepID=Q30YQ0_OLEA2|nr:hypothetical protein [Oleidesulfovibrio alaskensis]ABB39196.1 hypothetical protein Dde_2399 [Oleidesulfovibrio alaskensis G20]MBG0772046.1 hypothetical protein [Oleidesulfovibrio alaskensis]MBL3581716.1 hypothetical protein [Oleidesulfovibrio alaskensis]
MRNVIILFFAAFMLAGCAAYRSQLPVAATYPATPQYKMQSAGHWQVLASDVADRIEKALGDRDDLLTVPLYLRSPGSRPFAVGFYRLLTSELVSRGLQVSLNREKDNVNVDYAMYVVHHSPRYQRPPVGTFTAIAAGVSAARGLESISEWIPAAIGAGILADLASGAVARPSDNEVVISVSMSHNNRYVVHTSSVYYINDPDWELYMAPGESGTFVEEYEALPVRVVNR